MSSHLRKDLDRLERDIADLAGRVEGAVRRAMTAFLEDRLDLAREVIEGDEDIDRREVELEEDCLKILALHQPVAYDLRFVAACLKVDNDLERIGDLACTIAKRVESIPSQTGLEAREKLREMGQVVTRMLREALDAFMRADADAALAICDADDVVDRMNREVISGLFELMERSPGMSEAGVSLFSVSKALERIADHTTNIAEDVVYLVRGEIIRHQGAGGAE